MDARSSCLNIYRLQRAAPFPMSRRRRFIARLHHSGPPA